MRNLLIATQNPGKLREFQKLLATLADTLNVRLWAPGDLGIVREVAETGETYAQNASLKAQALAAISGLVTLGDDSGLEVDALGGAPGLYSARFAGPGASDADRRQKLLNELRQAAPPRPARFVCVVAVAQPALGLRLFHGECLGEIALAERGRGGFGYDPLFYVPAYGATMAELPPALKNTISHRARAIQAAQPYLEELLGAP